MQVGQRVLAGRQQLELPEPERQLATPARDRLARDAHDVAELGVADSGEELLAQPVGARQQLDPAAAILEVEEGGLPHQAAAHRATRQAVVRTRRGTGLQIPVRRPHLGDLGAVGAIRSNEVTWPWPNTAIVYRL